MSEHTLATSHLGVLQQIARALILMNDIDATFVQEKPDPDPEPVELDGFGRPVNLGGTTNPN